MAARRSSTATCRATTPSWCTATCACASCWPSASRACSTARLPADGVILTSGSVQAIALAANGFLGPGDAAIVEASSFPYGMRYMESTGAVLATAAVDDDGMDVGRGRAPARGALGARPATEADLHDRHVPAPDRHVPLAAAPPQADRAREALAGDRARGQRLRRAALRGRAPADAARARRLGPGDPVRLVQQDDRARHPPGLARRRRPKRSRPWPRCARTSA